MGEGGATGASSSEGPCPRFWHQARNLAAVSFDLLPAPRLPSSSGCPPGEVGDIGGGRARFGKPHNRKTQQPGVHPGNTRSLRHQQHQQRELNTHTCAHTTRIHGTWSPEPRRQPPPAERCELGLTPAFLRAVRAAGREAGPPRFLAISSHFHLHQPDPFVGLSDAFLRFLGFSHFHHFPHEETESQSGWIPFPRSQSW